jgi:lysozyme
MVKMHEGLRLELYKCPASRWTIGYGRNVQDVGITEQEATYLLENDLAKFERLCEMEFYFWDVLDVVRQSVLVDMAFNMGMGGLRQFKNFLMAVENKEWEQAGVHMLDSKWARQVHGRAKRLKTMMVTGEWAKV